MNKNDEELLDNIETANHIKSVPGISFKFDHWVTIRLSVKKLNLLSAVVGRGRGPAVCRTILSPIISGVVSGILSRIGSVIGDVLRTTVSRIGVVGGTTTVVDSVVTLSAQRLSLIGVVLLFLHLLRVELDEVRLQDSGDTEGKGNDVGDDLFQDRHAQVNGFISTKLELIDAGVVGESGVDHADAEEWSGESDGEEELLLVAEKRRGEGNVEPSTDEHDNDEDSEEETHGYLGEGAGGVCH